MAFGGTKPRNQKERYSQMAVMEHGLWSSYALTQRQLHMRAKMAVHRFRLKKTYARLAVQKNPFKAVAAYIKYRLLGFSNIHYKKLKALAEGTRLWKVLLVLLKRKQLLSAENVATANLESLYKESSLFLIKKPRPPPTLVKQWRKVMRSRVFHKQVVEYQASLQTHKCLAQWREKKEAKIREKRREALRKQQAMRQRATVLLQRLHPQWMEAAVKEAKRRYHLRPRILSK